MREKRHIVYAPEREEQQQRRHATFVDEQLGRANLSAWDAARRGFPLSLATPTTLRERIAAVTAEVERRQAESDNAFARAHRLTSGFGAVA